MEIYEHGHCQLDELQGVGSRTMIDIISQKTNVPKNVINERAIQNLKINEIKEQLKMHMNDEPECQTQHA